MSNLSIGVDLGGTKILAGIIDTTFRVICDPEYTEVQARLDLLEANHRQGKDDEELAKKFIEEIINDFDFDFDKIIESTGMNEIQINELFSEERPTEIENIKLELKNGNKLESLNLLNNFKETTAKKLFKNPCSKQWYDLIDTDSYHTKYCTDCRKNVYLVSTEEELIKRRNLEQCARVVEREDP